MDVISRKEAYKLGLDRYFTGEPCINGHLAEKRTETGACVECNREFSRANRKKIREKIKEIKEQEQNRINKEMELNHA